jgi:hypothetical protein
MKLVINNPEKLYELINKDNPLPWHAPIKLNYAHYRWIIEHDRKADCSWVINLYKIPSMKAYGVPWFDIHMEFHVSRLLTHHPIPNRICPIPINAIMEMDMLAHIILTMASDTAWLPTFNSQLKLY